SSLRLCSFFFFSSQSVSAIAKIGDRRRGGTAFKGWVSWMIDRSYQHIALKSLCHVEVVGRLLLPPFDAKLIKEVTRPLAIVHLHYLHQFHYTTILGRRQQWNLGIRVRKLIFVST
ncbi:hypothetical protein PIB30_049937, partial [Stylosanthes scabra]|nr:hypothetical protein [Stylosanthes scabra]